MEIYFYSIVSVLIVSLVSLIGVFTLSLRYELLQKYLFVIVSLAVGALLGDTFIHLIPEAFESIKNPLYLSLAILSGIFIFFILEKFLHWHHHEGIHDTHNHALGSLVIVSDGVHNFIDGIVIGASYLISVPVGIATTVAVILHEIPQEIGDFGVLLHAGYTKAKALWLNFISALFSLLGVIVAILLGNSASTFIIWLLPITAGGFIYIAMTDLIPELQKTKKVAYSLIQLVSILVGIGLMVLLILVE